MVKVHVAKRLPLWNFGTGNGNKGFGKYMIIGYLDHHMNGGPHTKTHNPKPQTLHPSWHFSDTLGF